MHEDHTTRLYMEQQLDAFRVAFTGKHYLLQGEVSQRHVKRQARDTSNPLLGMDALWQKLDRRFCTPLPKGNKQQNTAFILQAVGPYHVKTCYVLSTLSAWHQQRMPVDMALQEIVGSSSITIISFLPGKLAYFEGHSIGDRWLCQKR